MYTPPLVDVTSAEQAALSWLIYIDLLPLWPGTVANQGRLRQRYALLTLLVQFPDFTTVTATNSRNAANETECDWLFVQECTRVVATSPSASNTSTNSSSDSSSSVGAILGNGEEEDEDDVVVDVVINLYAIQSYTLPGSTLSPDLGLLSHLESFDASTNGLVGSIPAALGMATWSNLRLFAVSDNALTGRLSPSLGATWTKLAYFGVNNNALTGSLPPTLGVAWTKLYAFFVSTNQLTGTIPESLARYWTNVTYAYFYRNDFIGSMPSGFCAQTNVTELSADCFDEVQCDDDCCDFCCSDTGEDNEVCS